MGAEYAGGENRRRRTMTINNSWMDGWIHSIIVCLLVTDTFQHVGLPCVVPSHEGVSAQWVRGSENEIRRTHTFLQSR